MIGLIIRAAVSLVVMVLVYLGLHSANIPEDQRQKAYLIMAAVFIFTFLANILSKVFKILSVILFIGGIALLIYFLYSYNALPFISKERIDNEIVNVGI